jgi:hypothetical protein
MRPSLLVTVFALLIGGAARADCDMPMRPFKGPPSAQLAIAERDLKAGNYSAAYMGAYKLLARKEATDAQKAEAHAIEGWVTWRNGRHEEALEELGQAKALDPAAKDPSLAGIAPSIQAVLAVAPDAAINAALKKALEA